MMLPGWCRRAIPGRHIHKKVDADLAEVVKDNRAGPGDNPDADKIQGPFAGPENSVRQALIFTGIYPVVYSLRFFHGQVWSIIWQREAAFNKENL
jgi:hypothetical protein